MTNPTLAESGAWLNCAWSVGLRVAAEAVKLTAKLMSRAAMNVVEILLIISRLLFGYLSEVSKFLIAAALRSLKRYLLPLDTQEISQGDLRKT
jgi:hypothetical protein